MNGYARHDHGSGLLLPADPGTLAEAALLFNKTFDLSPGPPTLENLRKILDKFAVIPYENLSKIIKYQRFDEDANRIRLPLEVMEDFRRHHLGGTCFSLTCLLQAILTHSGYACYPVMADMSWGTHVHCAMVVVLGDSHFLADPGYLISEPLVLHKTEQRIAHTSFTGVTISYQESGEMYHLHTFNRSQSKWRYRFRDIPTPVHEFISHWLASFGWNTMHGLCLTRTEKDRMIYVHRTFMRETDFNGKRNFNIKAHYHATLKQIFGIREEIVDAALEALNANRVRDLGRTDRMPGREQPVSSSPAESGEGG